MIEDSDNASASALWRHRGGGRSRRRQRALRADGHHGRRGLLWGLTQTTAADQLTLLRQVFGDDSELTEASRTYLQGLMGRIAADQRLGGVGRGRRLRGGSPEERLAAAEYDRAVGRQQHRPGHRRTGTSTWSRWCRTATRRRRGDLAGGGGGAGGGLGVRRKAGTADGGLRRSAGQVRHLASGASVVGVEATVGPATASTAGTAA